MKNLLKYILLILVVFTGLNLNAQIKRKVVKNLAKQASYIVKVKDACFGDVAQLFSDAGIEVECKCIISEGMDLHPYRIALDNTNSSEDVNTIRANVSINDFELLRTFTVYTKEHLYRLQALPFIESIYKDEISITQDYDSSSRESLEANQYSITQTKLREALAHVFAKGYQPTNSLKVGVVDSGVQPHSDIIITEVYNFTHEEDGDLNGHGTHVSSIATSPLNNNGILGGFPFAKLVDGKALTKGGGGFSTDITKAIIQLVDVGCKVINLSLGPYSEPFSTDAINYCKEKGVVLVVAAGNSNTQVIHPMAAANPNNIAIGAVKQDGNRAGFSNWESFVVYTAGYKIIGASNGGSGAFTYKSGTSQAAPLASGIIALGCDYARWLGIELSPDQVKDLLFKSFDEAILDKGKSMRLNAYEFVKAIDALIEPEPSEVPLTLNDVIIRTGIGINTVKLPDGRVIGYKNLVDLEAFIRLTESERMFYKNNVITIK